MNGFDQQHRQVYNRFALQRSPQKFCGISADVAREASAMAPEQLSPASPHLVARLEGALR